MAGGGTKASDKNKGTSSWRKRRGLMLLLEAAQRGEFNHRVVYKRSRLARSARAGLEMVGAFDAAGVSVHVASEGIDYSPLTGKLLRTIMFAVAEMERENLREFVMDAVSERARAGKQHANLPGWIEKTPNAERRDETDIYRLKFPCAESVRTLCRLCIAGHSSVEIARVLNETGVPTVQGVSGHGPTS